MNSSPYKIFVDTGGTFTDCIAITPNGNRERRKVLSNSSLRGTIEKALSPTRLKIKASWELRRDILGGFAFRVLPDNYAGVKVLSYNLEMSELELSHQIDVLGIENKNFEITSHEEAPVLGARLLTQTALDEDFPPLILKLGSTKGTNALLECKGARTLFIITRGFADLLEIGNQARPNIFTLNIEKRTMLYASVIEVDERVDAKGNILQPLQIDELRKKLHDIDSLSFESVAVCCINSYLNPQHEQLIARELTSMGCKYISLSHQVSPLIKILNRAETAVVNAYLSPIITNYVDGIQQQIGTSRFQVMTSAGGLVQADHFYPKDSLLSGPAGGVVGAMTIGRQSGFTRLLTFDMGGTSTDVSRIDEVFDYKYELEVGDARINSPAISIETVAAGGGSICGFDGYKLFVGPESAGAYPGPACYGAGGPLTITDVNLLLGRLDVRQFGIPVFREESEARLSALLSEMQKNTGKERTREEVLQGFIDIANEIMAGAIRRISLSKGYDPGNFALVAFGGAGGLHTCDIASMLNIKTILLPRDAGLLSAYGIGSAAIERFAVKQVLMPFEQVQHNLENYLKECRQKASDILMDEGFNEVDINIADQFIFMRYKGQDSCLEIPFTSTTNLQKEYINKYQALYGHQVTGRAIEVESVRVIARVEEPETYAVVSRVEKKEASPAYHLDNGTPVFLLHELHPGDSFKGQALLLDHFATTFVQRGWKLEIDAHGTAILNLVSDASANVIQAAEETELELFTNRFMAIAENMGALLQRTSLSVNIKERLDFSCALLDAHGNLVANAPHIPVHLGGLGVCVRELLKYFTFEEGDTIVTNHPKYGGSHLPDVTMVTPIFYTGQRVGFVVNRAHHSEIGGISPGSMPPAARNLQEEGVVIAPFFLVRKGITDWTGIRRVLTDCAFPTRSIDENIADLSAALAANRNGAAAFLDLIHQHGEPKVMDYLLKLHDYAALRMADTLAKFKNGGYTATESLDDGSVIQVAVDIKDGRCHIDFSGSAPVNDSNMNATEAIVKSVVIYVLRLLLNEPIPLNDGLMSAVDVVLPHGMLNPVFSDDPKECPAVVGGNVEISQRLTDTLLKAFGVSAASQGTMNNTLFGNGNFGYYETVCGGVGAGNGFCGASAVHQHMTNTRITDAEILEHRYPVRLEAFSIRRGSGGAGTWKGGDGVRREIRFLEPVNLSVLTQRRKSGPYGLQGGADGLPGRQHVIRANGDVVELASIENIDLQPGDRFVMETPGGGGYGVR